jgi:hypothetical protein
VELPANLDQPEGTKTMTEAFTTDSGREITPEMQRKMAEKIGKLIAMSEDESLPKAARDTYAEKAEELMREYRINEEEVITSGGESASLPQAFRIVLVEGLNLWYSGEYADAYQRIWREIKNHAGLVGHVEYDYSQESKRNLVAVGYGYEIDIRLAQFLWTSAHLTFATRIDPKVNPRLSDQENCYYMRGAGMERRDVAKALWGSDEKDGAAHGKVHKLYLAECAARNEVPSVGGKGFQGKRYRDAYSNGFVDTFGWRLRDARSSVDAKQGGLVLHGRKERVQAAYFEAFPAKDPNSPENVARREQQSERSAAYWDAQAAAELECQTKGNCHKAMVRLEKAVAERGFPANSHEVDTAKCKNHRPYEATASDRARWEREENNPERSAGRRAGSAAASSVEFRRTASDRAQKAGSAERTALEG